LTAAKGCGYLFGLHLKKLKAMNKIENIVDLFNEATKLKVPSYQRAYAWEEGQLNQFISDMLELKDKGQYYYGHFILEERNDKIFEIIDGQQRLTTFILFLIVCKFLKKEGFDNYIGKFETVDYDQKAFNIIQNKLGEISDWEIENFGLTSEPTLSIQRILFALNHFKQLFKDRKQKLRLELEEIDDYVKVLTSAHISTHTTRSKAIAVQIFELQNTRGVKLNLIEKVKSKLMKAVYLNADSENAENIITDIQKEFAEIYRFEETASLHAFKGELTLDDILLHHLRMVDDGTKLFAVDKNIFNSPSKHGNREEAILVYLDKCISNKQSKEVVEYVIQLTNSLTKSILFVSKELHVIDKQNYLIGDVLILDKTLSLEFFILLSHKGFVTSMENEEIIRLWEKLLFTRDFHGRYFRLQYTDDFERFFLEVAASKESLNKILERYVKKGFRDEKMIEGSLPKTVQTYIQENKSNILNNAFHWWSGKMVYTLYKYESSIDANRKELREIMKKGRSVEHILPQEWQWDWIGEKDANSLTEEGKIKDEEIRKMINGIGNLLLISVGENSSQSNKHPNKKVYVSCSGGSYSNHNLNKEQWEDKNNWSTIINSRGKKIFEFLENFIL
jgi:hypothetical protein